MPLEEGSLMENSATSQSARPLDENIGHCGDGGNVSSTRSLSSRSRSRKKLSSTRSRMGGAVTPASVSMETYATNVSKDSKTLTLGEESTNKSNRLDSSKIVKSNIHCRSMRSRSPVVRRSPYADYNGDMDTVCTETSQKSEHSNDSKISNHSRKKENLQNSSSRSMKSRIHKLQQKRMNLVTPVSQVDQKKASNANTDANDLIDSNKSEKRSKMKLESPSARRLHNKVKQLQSEKLERKKVQSPGSRSQASVVKSVHQQEDSPAPRTASQRKRNKMARVRELQALRQKQASRNSAHTSQSGRVGHNYGGDIDSRSVYDRDYSVCESTLQDYTVSSRQGKNYGSAMDSRSACAQDHSVCDSTLQQDHTVSSYYSRVKHQIDHTDESVINDVWEGPTPIKSNRQHIGGEPGLESTGKDIRSGSPPKQDSSPVLQEQYRKFTSPAQKPVNDSGSSSVDTAESSGESSSNDDNINIVESSSLSTAEEEHSRDSFTVGTGPSYLSENRVKRSEIIEERKRKLAERRRQSEIDDESWTLGETSFAKTEVSKRSFHSGGSKWGERSSTSKKSHQNDISKKGSHNESPERGVRRHGSNASNEVDNYLSTEDCDVSIDGENFSVSISEMPDFSVSVDDGVEYSVSIDEEDALDDDLTRTLDDVWMESNSIMEEKVTSKVENEEYNWEKVEEERQQKNVYEAEIARIRGEEERARLKLEEEENERRRIAKEAEEAQLKAEKYRLQLEEEKRRRVEEEETLRKEIEQEMQKKALEQQQKDIEKQTEILKQEKLALEEHAKQVKKDQEEQEQRLREEQLFQEEQIEQKKQKLEEIKMEYEIQQQKEREMREKEILAQKLRQEELLKQQEQELRRKEEELKAKQLEELEKKERDLAEREDQELKQKEKELKEREDKLKEQGREGHQRKEEQVELEHVQNEEKSQLDKQHEQIVKANANSSSPQHSLDLVSHKNSYSYANELDHQQTTDSTHSRVYTASPKSKGSSFETDEKNIVPYGSPSRSRLKNESRVVPEDEEVSANFFSESIANESVANSSVLDGGSETLSEWWQKTYASTQDPEINNVISQALSSRILHDDTSNSISVSNDNSTQLMVAKKMTKVLSAVQSDSDDDDIFGGIGDDSDSDLERDVVSPPKKKLSQKAKKNENTQHNFFRPPNPPPPPPKTEHLKKRRNHKKSLPKETRMRTSSNNRHEDVVTKRKNRQQKPRMPLNSQSDDIFDGVGSDADTETNQSFSTLGSLSENDQHEVSITQSNLNLGQRRKLKQHRGPAKFEETSVNEIPQFFADNNRTSLFDDATRFSSEHNFSTNTSLIDTVSPTENTFNTYSNDTESFGLNIETSRQEQLTNDFGIQFESSPREAHRYGNMEPSCASVSDEDSASARLLSMQRKNKFNENLLSKFNDQVSPKSEGIQLKNDEKKGKYEGDGATIDHCDDNTKFKRKEDDSTFNNRFDGSKSGVDEFDDDEEEEDNNDSDGDSTASNTNTMITEQNQSTVVSRATTRASTKKLSTIGDTTVASSIGTSKVSTARTYVKSKKDDSAQSNFFSQFGCSMLDVFANTLCRDPNHPSGFRTRGTGATDSRAGDDTVARSDDDASSEESDSDSDTNTNSNTNTDGSKTVDSWSAVESKKGTESVTTYGLSQQELKVWEDWDSKDDRPIVTTTGKSVVSDFDESASHLSRLTELEDKQKLAQHLERRARAHEKLLLYAYSALSVPQSNATVEKSGGYVGRDIKTPQSKSGLSKRHSVGKTSPVAVASKIAEERPLPPQPHSWLENMSSPSDQRGALDNFCSKMKAHGLEVLKLNRDKKWQTRYLTLSKEVTWVGGEQGGDRASYPKGILWLKKFNAKSSYSVSSIGNKGGMLLHRLLEARVADERDVAPLSKKQSNGKFKESIVLALHCSEEGGISRTVVIRCRNKDDAQFFMVGLGIVIELLHSNRPSSSSHPSGLAQHFISSNNDEGHTKSNNLVSPPKVKVLGGNLW